MKAKIGLEIHAELKTNSKMFCSCDNNADESEPNSLICPICLGYPGILPVINKQAVEWTIKTGLALNCKINKQTHFDRKHYFYPDLPKNFQISQYKNPICNDGYIEIGGRKIGIRRVHLEEDTAKLIHPVDKTEWQVDFNRVGTPLMEIVTEPDIQTAQEAREYSQKIRQILRYLGISDADMEKGHMRCEANISVSNSDQDGVKVEVKNLNSFRSVEKAIDYEIKRQIKLLKSGSKIIQETRGWNDSKKSTFSQRVKETAPDYRYFPEPDLPPLKISDKLVKQITAILPELPDQKIKRFIKTYKIGEKEAEILTSNIKLANYYEEILIYKANPRRAAFWIITEILAVLKKEGKSISDNIVKSKDLADLIISIDTGKISGKIGKVVFRIMIDSGRSPKEIIQESKFGIMSDEAELEKIIQKIIRNNQKVIEDYKKGKKEALQFIVGQIMKKTKGRANPQTIINILKRRLG